MFLLYFNQINSAIRDFGHKYLKKILTMVVYIHYGILCGFMFTLELAKLIFQGGSH